MIQGKVYSVAKRTTGGELIESAAVGSQELVVEDASDFDELGGQLSLGGVIYDYDSVDMDEDVIHLTTGLTVAVDDGEMAYLHPESEEMTAIVTFEGGESVEARIPHTMNLTIREGERQADEAETVSMTVTGGGYVITDILGRVPIVDAASTTILNINEAFIDDQQRLSTALEANAQASADADARLTQAEADLEAARARLTTAETGLSTLGSDLTANEQALADAQAELDQAELDIIAAKQEAIDAAALDATAKADAAEAAAQADLADAQAALQAAIASGDANAVATANAAIAAAKQEAITAAALDATDKAAQAMTKANEALTVAQAAQATADNTIRTWYDTVPPWPNNSVQPEEVLGDMWYDDNTGQAYRWNGTTWVVIVDQTVGQALDAAQNAQATADGKITAYYQNTEPMGGDEGDLWFDLDDNNKVYRRTASAWVSVADSRIALQATQLGNLQSDLAGVEGTLDGKSNVWVQAAAPTGLTTSDKGDIWINNGASPRITKVWTGSAWIEADSRTTKAVEDIAKKVTTYYSATSAPTAPTGGFTVGDLWVNATGKIARWNGSWVTMVDPKALADAAQANAATDATTKANAARQAAIDSAATSLNTAKTNLEAAIASGDTAAIDAAKADAAAKDAVLETALTADAQAKANAARQAAIDAAKLDATAKANAAELAAIEAASDDAAAKANDARIAAEAAANLYAETVASEAEQAAIDAAKLDATTKANAAKAAAEAAAIAAAKADATTKANAARAGALADAKTYTDAEKAAWLNSAALTAQEKADLAEAAAIAESDVHLHNATNLINNFTRTGTLDRWNAAGSTLVDVTFEGRTVKALQHISDGNTYAGITNYFTVDPSKAYEVSVYTRHSTVAGQTTRGAGRIFMGTNQRGTTSNSIKTVNVSNGASSDSSNFYFHSTNAQVDGEWVRWVGYILPAGSDPQNGVGLGETVNMHAMMHADTYEIALRFLNYYNSGTPSNLQLLAPTVTETSIEAIRQARAANYAANNVTSAQIVNGAVVTNKLASGAVISDKLATGSVVAGKLAANSVLANNIKALEIDTGHLKADAITADKIATNAVTADAISANSIGTIALSANAVTADKLLVDTALANKMNANIANIIQANVGNLTVTGDTHLNNLVAQRIAADAGQFISLTVEQLVATGTSTLNSVVAQTIATEIADIVQANIGNLTVTGDAHLNEVTAQRIAADVGSYVTLTVDQLLAGNLDVVLNVSAGGAIVAGDPNGRAAQLEPDGLALYDVNPDGERYPSTVLGGPGADQLSLLDANGDVIAGIDAEGGIAGNSLQVNDDIVVGGTSLLGSHAVGATEFGWLDQSSKGLVASTTGTKSSPQRNTAETWGYMATPFVAKAGRTYLVMSNADISTGSTGSYYRIYHYVKTGGGAVTVNDELVQYAASGASANGGVPHNTTLTTYMTYPVDTQVEVLLAYRGLLGATPTVERASTHVVDGGLYEDMSRAGYYSTGGATASEPPPVQIKTYTSTWHATGSASYRGNGTKRTDANDLVQGYTSYAPINGHNQAAVVFTGLADSGETDKSVAGALAGATIIKAEIYLYFDHWYYGSGGTARIGKLGGDSIPSTLNATASKSVSNWKRGQGKWVTVPTSWFSDGNRGITLGGGSSTNALYYGRAAGHGAGSSRRPKMRLTYTR